MSRIAGVVLPPILHLARRTSREFHKSEVATYQELRRGWINTAVLLAILRPRSGEPFTESQVVHMSSAVPARLRHFVTAANSRALRNIPYCMSRKTIPAHGWPCH